MTLSNLSQILLRLFSLHLFFKGLLYLPSVIFILSHYFNVQESSILISGSHMDFLGYVLPTLLHIIGAIVLWRYAPKLSKTLAAKSDSAVDFKGITETHLYTAVFLGLGLYFVLDSFADCFNWAHYFIINSPIDFGFHHENKGSYYKLIHSALTLIAGIFFICSCRHWGRKLSKK